MRQSTHYERDDETFNADAYQVSGYRGIAWHVLGWQTESDSDTEWSGYESRTGYVLAVMIGDDKRHVIDKDDLVPIEREAFCSECGQIGCTHDGYDRSNDND